MAISEVRPIRHPDGTALGCEDFETWFGFDCKERADSYEHFDGYIRCLDCAAKWAEHHLDIEEWR